MLQSAAGKVAAIEMKINSDMPLPTPRSVMSSPIHMMRPLPAFITRIMSRMAYQESSVSSWLHCGVPVDCGKSAPLRATVTSVVAWRMPRPIVR